MSKQKHSKRYSETEIVRILQEISQGKALAEVARQCNSPVTTEPK